MMPPRSPVELKRSITTRKAACAFAYELRDVDTKNFNALVTNAELTEISLTDCPANPNARVERRYKTAPVASYLKALGDTDALLLKGVGLIQQ